MILLLVRVIPPPAFAAVGLQLPVTVKALHGAAAPVMARTTTSAQVRTLQGLPRVEGMVSGIFDGIRQGCCGLVSTQIQLQSTAHSSSHSQAGPVTSK